MLDAESRDLRHAEPLGRDDLSVAGDSHAALVDQDRVDESERLNTVGDQLDLALGVSASVARVRLDVFEGARSRCDRWEFSAD
jgi:hypothetical protein